MQLLLAPGQFGADPFRAAGGPQLVEDRVLGLVYLDAPGGRTA